MNSKKINKVKMKELIKLADNKRSWNESFVKYTEMIVNHPNYKGLFFERGTDNRVKWVITGKSDKGKERRNWWDTMCNQNDITIEPGCYAKIALKIHPTKIHICQICGKGLSIEYVYPNARLLTAFKKEFGISISPFSKDIYHIIDDIVQNNEDLEKVKRIFKIKNNEVSTILILKNFIKEEFVNNFAKGFFSPGAMSNSPDRLDGYHSDGACCRHESDKGRHKDNLQRYGQDRRVYENWADGDWKMADRLMSCFRKHGLSADHIGPISLGFAHRPKFNPLTKEANSAKNNRMSFKDVEELIADEKNGDVVVSWHSSFIWDNLKNNVKDDKDAVKLSDLMRKNMHFILIVFSMIEEKGYAEFLEQFINIEYSFFDYSFEGFDPNTGRFTSYKQVKRTGKNQQNNVKRFYRVAFDRLKEYKTIENRKVNKWVSQNIDNEVSQLLTLLKSNQNVEAKIQLEKIFKMLAELGQNNW